MLKGVGVCVLIVGDVVCVVGCEIVGGLCDVCVRVGLRCDDVSV